MDVGELGLVGNDDGMIDEIDWDWEHLLGDVPEQGLDFFDSEEKENHTAAMAVGTVDSWMGELEQLLMKDDDIDIDIDIDHGKEEDSSINDFHISEMLMDSPDQDQDQRRSSSSSGLEVVDDDKNSLTCSDSDPIVDANPNTTNPNPKFDSIARPEDMDAALELNDSKEDDTDDDPLSKKRKRQLRNKDAAMRSRERKKMYVKDLEVKSRYLEAECRRLGRLLQCCYAENQMLRFSIQSGTTFGNSMAKPESAVLLLESLLLGSLVWLMGLMCLHPLATLLLLSQDAVAVASIDKKEVENAAPPRRKGVKAIQVWLPLSYLRSKRCKASRTKMKHHFDTMQCCCLGNPSFSHSTPEAISLIFGVCH